jgi:hypothetical protein
MPGSMTTPGRADTRYNASFRVAFHSGHGVGTRDQNNFAAQWLACTPPLPTLRRATSSIWTAVSRTLIGAAILPSPSKPRNCSA